MKRLLLCLSAIFVLALLIALGASVVAGSPGPAAVASADSPQPDTATSDLEITKSRFDTGPIMPGSLVTYTLMVTNTGPDLAADVRVTDTLPSQVTYQSCTAGAGPCGPSFGAGPGGADLVLFYPGEMPDGRTVVFRIVVRVNYGTSGQIVNKGETRSASADSHTSDNVAFLTLTVTSPATATPTATPRAPRQRYFPVIMKDFLGGTTTTTIFSDNFNDGTLHGWSPYNSTWYNENNYMRGTSGPGNGWNIKNASGGNFTYEGDVNILSGTAAGLAFRASSDGRSSYNVMVDAVADQFKIVKQPGNAVLVSYASTISPNHWYALKVVVNGTQIEGYLNGVKRLTVNDPNFSSGRFGAAVTSAVGAFDNLVARTLP